LFKNDKIICGGNEFYKIKNNYDSSSVQVLEGLEARANVTYNCYYLHKHTNGKFSRKAINTPKLFVGKAVESYRVQNISRCEILKL
jgi:hypothetical protein